MKFFAILLATVLFAGSAEARGHHHRHHRHHARVVARAAVAGAVTGGQAAVVVANPAGCPPVQFCGCGVARYIFGEIHGAVRQLWLAANWLRKFQRAEPAAGMVAAREHHVFAILENRGHGIVLAYDPNSGGHKTRIHLRSIAGYTIVDPHRPHT